eukprot:TRINITY_DN4048_c0_g1_i3.p1 TRINITY_DN4048_c0_g1~~TRINITY_DN4048_c0_g1_i3.p1  ORF type:complete len:161 (-),score=32.25 TRINITY_DN4048_c0_g1_i3:302-784(-)
MSMRLKSKLLVAKNYVSTKMGLEAFQEPPEITQRKKDLKAAEALYADLELKVTGFTKSLEANYRASVEVSKFLLTFPEEGQTPAQKDAFRNYGDSFVRVNDSDQKWVSRFQTPSMLCTVWQEISTFLTLSLSFGTTLSKQIITFRLISKYLYVYSRQHQY